MQRVAIAGVVLSLVANAILGGIAANHLRQIETLQSDRESLESELDDLEFRLADQVAEIETLKSRPEVNIRELATTLVGLRGDVDDLSGDVSSLSFRLNDVEFQIERPPFCFSDDAVYWAGGFGGGFTC